MNQSPVTLVPVCTIDIDNTSDGNSDGKEGRGESNGQDRGGDSNGKVDWTSYLNINYNV